MLYAIYACENQYQGLYGMNASDIVDIDSYEEAELLAEDMSLDVMNSYSCIIDSWEEEIRCKGIEEDSDALDEAMKENMYYSIYEITHTFDESLGELRDEFWNNQEEFIRRYCS